MCIRDRSSKVALLKWVNGVVLRTVASSGFDLVSGAFDGVTGGALAVTDKAFGAIDNVADKARGGAGITSGRRASRQWRLPMALKTWRFLDARRGGPKRDGAAPRTPRRSARCIAAQELSRSEADSGLRRAARIRAQRALCGSRPSRPVQSARWHSVEQ